MLSINLIPAEEKQALRLEETRRMIIFLAVMTLLIFAAGFVFLVPALAVTYIAEREFIRSLAAEEGDLSRETTRKTLLEARARRDAIAEVVADSTRPPKAARLLERLIDPGEGITMTSLLIQRDGTMALRGHAVTRAQLLHFEEALRGSNRFHAITFPLSNIVRESDIEFVMQGKLKAEYGL